MAVIIFKILLLKLPISSFTGIVDVVVNLNTKAIILI